MSYFGKMRKRRRVHPANCRCRKCKNKRKKGRSESTVVKYSAVTILFFIIILSSCL